MNHFFRSVIMLFVDPGSVFGVYGEDLYFESIIRTVTDRTRWTIE
ncbi:MAG: hypothetical protein WD315_07250 [Balneolaceae bacterium]